MADLCHRCRHYQPPKHHELVGYCLRTHPHKVAWDERDDGECGKDGKHYEDAQGELFARNQALCGVLE